MPGTPKSVGQPFGARTINVAFLAAVVVGLVALIVVAAVVVGMLHPFGGLPGPGAPRAGEDFGMLLRAGPGHGLMLVP